MAELELELNRCQQLPVITGKKKDIHLKRFIAKCKKYGKKGPYILGMVVKYVDDKLTLRNMLLLNKIIYSKIKICVFRQVLINLSVKMSIPARVQIWAQILDVVIFLYKLLISHSILEKLGDRLREAHRKSEERRSSAERY